jgi:hypothetical protein
MEVPIQGSTYYDVTSPLPSQSYSSQLNRLNLFHKIDFEEDENH